VLNLRNVRIHTNQATVGGGISNLGSVTGTAVEISGNTAAERAGGAMNEGNGTLTLTNSFIRNNTANAQFAALGGGIAQLSSGAVTLTNTAVSGNRAARGGGLYLGAAGSALRSSVVSQNAATDTGGGVFTEAGATLTRTVTAIVANTPNNCAGAVSC
jgi:hypothetical protein